MNGYIVYIIIFCNNKLRTYEKNIATYQCKLIGLYIKHLNFCFRDYRIGFTFEVQHTVNPLIIKPPGGLFISNSDIWGGLNRNGGLIWFSKDNGHGVSSS